MLKRLLVLLSALAFAGCASAQTVNPKTITPVFFHGAASGGVNACNGVLPKIQIDYTKVQPDCFNGTSYANPSLMPGGVLTFGSLSGAGATTETCTDTAGLVHDFASGERSTNAGDCLERAATNLVTFSQSYASGAGNGWACTTCTVGTNNVLAPDGTNTAALVTITTANGSGLNNSAAGFTEANNTSYVVSMDWKPVSGSNSAYVAAKDSGNAFAYALCTASGATFSSNGNGYTVTAEGQYTRANGYLRCWIAFTTGGTSAGNTGYADPGGVTNGDTWDVWNIQEEVGTGPTSELPTSGGTATRSADVSTNTCSICVSSDFAANIYASGNFEQYLYNATSGLVMQSINGQPISGSVVSVTEPAPIFATGAGYASNTFLTQSFTTANTDTGFTFNPGFQWYCNGAFGNTCGGNALSLTGGVASITTNVGGMTSGGVTTAGNNWRGMAFGGGAYFEATLTFNDANVNTANGWPSWWLYSIENLGSGIASLTSGPPGAYNQWLGQTAGYSHYLEADIMEYDFGGTGNTYGASVHDWYFPGSSQNYKISPFAVGKPAAYTTIHRYGGLWIPATANSLGSFTDYLDGQPLTPNVTWHKYAWTVTTNGTISTGSATITMVAANAAALGTYGTDIVSGYDVFDQTTSQDLGTFNGTWSANVLHLSGNAAHNGSGSSDVLVLTPPPPPSGASVWAFGVGDIRHFALMFGAGSNANAPINMYDVHVWQTNATNNLSN
jgi:hypothetical protein